MTKYNKQIRIAVMVCLLVLLGIYFSNRGCSPSAPYLCWTPVDYGGPSGGDTYVPHRARTWHKYCNAECRKPSECYYFCCGGDNRFDQSEAPVKGDNSCRCYFGDHGFIDPATQGICMPGMAGNMRDLLERGSAGELAAQLTLGQLYETGRYGDPVPSAREAFYWYSRAAEQGSIHGQYKAGEFLEAGKGVMAHCTRAMEWYEKAGRKRDKPEEPAAVTPAESFADSYYAAQAQARLGDIYEKGSCGPFDYAKAVHWYTLAEEGQRDTTPLPEEAAALHLGDLYMKGGYGLEKNPAEAIKWYRTVAKAQTPPANGRAEFALAMIYAKGDVVEQDFQTACRWYAAAGRDARYRSNNICDPIEPYLMPGELETVTPKIGSGVLPD